MIIVIYLVAGVVILSGASYFVGETGYWKESIALVQVVMAIAAVTIYYKKITIPIRALIKKTGFIKEGQLEAAQAEKIDLEEFKYVDQLLYDMSLNIKNAIGFIKNIEDGNLEVDINLNGNGQGTDSDNQLGRSLLNLRDKLNTIAVSERERNWVNEGLARFVEILRTNNEDIKSISDKILSNLVNYLKANQGQIYVLNNEDVNNPHLEMTAFYAFDRKKFFEKTVEIGQGLVGQAYQERETILLTEIPDDYIKVTSGLGEANPRCLLIAPLKINQDVYGVLELASFQKFKPHEIEFVEKIGESIASTISNARVNQKTKSLLEDLQQQQEEMKAQEEEMRQNMEELQATQEEMSRKEKEITHLLEMSNAKEKELADKLNEIEKMTEALELENAMFTTLMDVLADRVTIKDRQGTYIRLNKTKTDALRKDGIENAIGKTDREFFGDEHFIKALKLEKEIMDSGTGVMNKEEKINLADGGYWWASTSRVPFKTREGRTLGTLVVTRDITKEKDYQEKLEEAMVEIEKLKNSDTRS